jgi:hypothetical protein
MKAGLFFSFGCFLLHQQRRRKKQENNEERPAAADGGIEQPYACHNVPIATACC